MNKKILALLVAIAMLVILLAACDLIEYSIQQTDSPAHDSAEDEPQQTDGPAHDSAEDEAQQTTVDPARGVWEDGVFTSEYLGLRFELPEGWFVATDEEMAEITGSLEGRTEAMTDDMWAANAMTDAGVWIDFERLSFPHNRMSEPEFIEWRIRAIENADWGWEVSLISSDTTRIGNYEWHSFETVWHASGNQSSRRTFVNIQDNFVRSIDIDFNEQSESLEEILSYFSNL